MSNCIPRVSGGEPYQKKEPIAFYGYSPRERG